MYNHEIVNGICLILISCSRMWVWGDFFSFYKLVKYKMKLLMEEEKSHLLKQEDKLKKKCQ